MPATTNYNSLQAALRMENKHGLTAQLAYTYAHQIDEQTDDLNGASESVQPEVRSASGGYDRRHNFEANYVYNIPFFMHADSFAERSVLGGWVFSGVTTFETGLPANVTYGTDTAGVWAAETTKPSEPGGQGKRARRRRRRGSNTSAFGAPTAPWNGAGTTALARRQECRAGAGPGQLEPQPVQVLRTHTE